MNSIKRFYPLTVLLLLISCSTDRTNEQDVSMPNILWITCEDLSPILGSYNDRVAITPNLDKLAEAGIQYNNAYATASVCSPARSCLVTGMYASSLGTHNHRSDFKVPAEIRTLPHILRGLGYYCSNNYKKDYNFTDSTIWDESGHNAHWRNRPKEKPFFSVFNFETTHQSRIFGDDDTFYQRFGKLLSEEQRHHPDSIVLPPYFFDTPEVRKLWARYYDVVTIMDRQVGDILNQLDEDGLKENTIVFYFSDHGTGMPRSKGVMYSSGIQVPLIIYIPEKYSQITDHRPGTITDDIVSFVDFQPTILSIINQEAPSYMQGVPFLGTFRGDSRKYAYATRDRTDEIFDISRTVKSSNYSYIRNFLPHLPLIQPSFYRDKSEIMIELYRLKKTISMTPAQQTMWQTKRLPEELYDLEKDPHEINNLAQNSEYREILLEMRQNMKEWMIHTHDLGLMPEGYMIAKSKQKAVYETAKSSEIYPLQEILNVNDLILDQPIDQTKLVDMLRHGHPLVRYWAAVSLQYLSDPLPGTLDGLNDALSDESLYVRLAAADAMCAFDMCTDDAQKAILGGLNSESMMDILMAARIFELHKKKATLIVNDVMEIHSHLKEMTDENQWKGYDINAVWALNYAFKNVE